MVNEVFDNGFPLSFFFSLSLNFFHDELDDFQNARMIQSNTFQRSTGENSLGATLIGLFKNTL